jgi:hypothetical protein
VQSWRENLNLLEEVGMPGAVGYALICCKVSGSARVVGEVSHEAVRGWEVKLLPVMGNELRKRRHGTGRGAGISWYVDETYLKLRSQCCGPTPIETIILNKTIV